MAGFPLATACAVAFHLCLLVSSSSAGSYGRTAYHFQPAKNWQNANHVAVRSRPEPSDGFATLTDDASEQIRMTFPRKVWLDKDGKQLRQWPIEEIEMLRRKRAGLRQTVVNAGAMNEIVGVTGSQADVEVVFKIPSLVEAETLDPNWLLDPQKLCGAKGASVQGGVGPFGLIVMASGDLQEHTAVFFRVFKHHGNYKVLMCTDLTKSSTRAGVYNPPYGRFVDIDIEEHKSIKLRTLIDHSVVESFGAGGRACIMARVYPEHVETSNSHLFVFNNGTDAVKVAKLEAWELAAATVNVGDNGLIVSESMRKSEPY